MAPTRGPSGQASKSLVLDETVRYDVDPEDGANVREDDASDSDPSEDDHKGTEHYVTVGPGKLRQRESVTLGPRYRGSRISRAALEEDSDSDMANPSGEEDEDEDEDGQVAATGNDGHSPAADYDEPEDLDLDDELSPEDDEEIDSDEAFGEGDAERFTGFAFSGSSKPTGSRETRPKRPVAADFLTPSDDGESSLSDQEGGASLSRRRLNGARDPEDDESSEPASGEDDEEDDSMASDDSEDEEDDSDGQGAADTGRNDGDRAELRKLMSQGQKHMADSLSQAAKADVEKGMAVRQQRKNFDTMLNLRIRLQKALVAANSFETAMNGADTPEELYVAAEEAAVKLLDTISSLHTEASNSDGKKKNGQKRKRKVVTGMSSQEIWDVLQSSDEAATSKRREVLDKWSNRVSQTTTQPTVRKLGPTPRPQSLLSVLDEQLAGMDRLIKRTRTPRSCAPVQAAKKVQEDAGIYDDADFYQLLLKELVDQRAGDSSSAPGGGSLPTVSWAAIKEARTRKEVDRKASKGRKLRFNVHEKLQNFMAPEDRGTWEQDAIDRFFHGLFGRKAGGEVEADGSDREAEEDDEMADGHLRLFGS